MTLCCFGCQTTLGHTPMMNQISMKHILILVMCPGPMFPEVQVCDLYTVLINNIAHLCAQSHCLYLSSDSMSTLNLTIQTHGNVSSVNAQPVLCEVIGSLISIFREFRALCSLRNGSMLRPVLAPHVSYFTHNLHSPPDLDVPVSLGLSEVVGSNLDPRTYSIAHFVCLHLIHLIQIMN